MNKDLQVDITARNGTDTRRAQKLAGKCVGNSLEDHAPNGSEETQLTDDFSTQNSLISNHFDFVMFWIFGDPSVLMRDIRPTDVL